jgi:hypothetical protein
MQTLMLIAPLDQVISWGGALKMRRVASARLARLAKAARKACGKIHESHCFLL